MSKGFPQDINPLEVSTLATICQYKSDYAYALLKTPNDPFKAALVVFPSSHGVALQVSNEWPYDNEVIRFMGKHLDEYGEESFLPTKSQFLSTLWDKLEKTKDASDYTRLADVYAKARGFYPQKGVGDTSINVTGESCKVMIVKACATDEEWETKIAEQQRKLTAYDAD